MTRLLQLLLLVSCSTLAGLASEKSNTVLIHPGEVVYARFTQSGAKLKLVKASTAKDDGAQLVLTLDPVIKDKKDYVIKLKVENRFKNDVHYEAQMRSLALNKHMPATVFPVVAGKISLVPFLPVVDEVALWGFELEL